MKKVLLIINVRVKNNPALLFFIKALQNDFDISISGNDDLESCVHDCLYTQHGSWYRLFIILKFHWILKIFLVKLFKNEDLYNQSLINIRLFLSSKELFLKTRKPDITISIDSEAGYLARTFSSKVKKCFYIYDFYADQFLNISKSYQLFLEKIERDAVIFSDVLISVVNQEMGIFLNSRYKTQKDILVLSVTPPSTFNESIEPIQEPISIYYHGIIIENRGLENLVSAVKKYSGIKIFIRGEGDLLPRLKQMSIELGVMDRVEFLEPVPTQMLSQVAKQYDFGITMVRMNVLNHQYAAGFKTFENLSAGLALILPESYPLKKFNQEYNVGITYSDATVEELERVFEYILHHKEEIMIWKKNVRSAYHQEYNPARQKEKLIQKINQLIHA